AAHANRARLDGRRPPLGMGGPEPPPDPSRPPDLRGPQAPVQPLRPRADLPQDRCLRFCLKSVTGCRPRPIRPATSRRRLARLLGSNRTPVSETAGLCLWPPLSGAGILAVLG